MDAAVVLAIVKWVMTELVRIFHSTTPEKASEVVESLAERTIPILWQVGGLTRVLGGLSVKDKTMVLLYGSAGPPLRLCRTARTPVYSSLARIQESLPLPHNHPQTSPQGRTVAPRCEG
jgi:hypothetical protein